jgi:hypothetical protein
LSKNDLNKLEIGIIDEFLNNRISQLRSQDINQIDFLAKYFRDLQQTKSFRNPNEPFTPVSDYLNNDSEIVNSFENDSI